MWVLHLLHTWLVCTLPPCLHTLKKPVWQASDWAPPTTRACDRTLRRLQLKRVGGERRTQQRKAKGEEGGVPWNAPLSLPLCFLSGSVMLQCFPPHLRFWRLCLPVVLRWILWTAQRTSSLRRVCRTWETSTTSQRALAAFQNTSAPFVGTAPQVTTRGNVPTSPADVTESMRRQILISSFSVLMTDDHLWDARREIVLNQGWVVWHYSSDLLEQGKRLHKCEMNVA